MNNLFDDFLDKAKDVADVATKKTNQLVEMSKYKIESIKINNEIKNKYEQLGSSVYSMVKKEYKNESLIESMVEEIDDSLKKLAVINSKLADMKNMIVCKSCGARNPQENLYCAKCGSKIKSEFSQTE